MGDARLHAQGTPRSRQGRKRALALLFLATSAAAPLIAQCSGAIPNFRVTDETPGVSIALAWDAPGGAPPSTTYEIVRTTAPGYCSIPTGTANGCTFSLP